MLTVEFRSSEDGRPCASSTPPTGTSANDCTTSRCGTSRRRRCSASSTWWTTRGRTRWSLAGDVFDTQVPQVAALELWEGAVDRIVGELGVPMVVIPGNHDHAERMSLHAGLARRAGLHILHTLAGCAQCVRIGGVAFYGVPFHKPVHVNAAFRDDGARAGRVRLRRRDAFRAGARAGRAGRRRTGGPGRARVRGAAWRSPRARTRSRWAARAACPSRPSTASPTWRWGTSTARASWARAVRSTTAARPTRTRSPRRARRSR